MDDEREESSVIFRASHSYPQDCEHGVRKVSALFTVRFMLMGIDSCDSGLQLV